jgi:large subunit ribosomal protein L31
MKEGIHPVYKDVIYKDVSNGFRFLTRSTKVTNEKEVWEDGKEYPVVKVEISSSSHPFFTGKEKLMDTEGRIDRFNKRYQKGAKK